MLIPLASYRVLKSSSSNSFRVSNETFCAICYHLYNLKNMKNPHREVLLLEKLQIIQMIPNRAKHQKWSAYVS